MDKTQPGFAPPPGWAQRLELELGASGRSALRRLVRGGVDRPIFLWNLWWCSRPEFWNTLQEQSAQGTKTFRRDISRFKSLADDLRSLETRLLQAVNFFKLPPDSPVTTLAVQLPNGAAELEGFCAIYSDKGKLVPRPLRTHHDFVDLVIHIVRVQFRHKKREEKPWTGDLALVLNAAVNAHNWKARKKPREFSGDSIRRYLERHERAVKPNVIECG